MVIYLINTKLVEVQINGKTYVVVHEPTPLEVAIGRAESFLGGKVYTQNGEHYVVVPK